MELNTSPREMHDSCQKQSIQKYPVIVRDSLKMKFINDSTTGDYLYKWINYMKLNNFFGGIYPKDKSIDNLK